jgi:hypothetical protein
LYDPDVNTSLSPLNPVSVGTQAPDTARRIARMVRLARLMDSAFKIPGTTLTIGLDPLIGLIPAVGDVITTGVSLVILYDAIRLGATGRQILEMVANICVDFLLSEIPILGDAVDAFFKANIRNLQVMGIDPAMQLGPGDQPVHQGENPSA